MIKVDETVKRESLYIVWTALLLSLLMEAVFLILGQWSYRVLLGNLLGYLAAVGNFFLMGLTVQKAVLKEEKEAKQLMRMSHSYRRIGMMVLLIIGLIVPVFHKIAMIAPIFFPRIAIAMRPILNQKKEVNTHD